MPNYKVTTIISLEVSASNAEEAVALAEANSFDEWDIVDNEVTEL